SHSDEVSGAVVPVDNVQRLVGNAHRNSVIIGITSNNTIIDIRQIYEQALNIAYNPLQSIILINGAINHIHQTVLDSLSIVPVVVSDQIIPHPAIIHAGVLNIKSINKITHH